MSELSEAKDYIKKIERVLEIYKAERERFRHNYAEITGAYFLSGGYGDTDTNMLPRYVRICPAYGVGWEQVYEKTDKTLSTEGG